MHHTAAIACGHTAARTADTSSSCAGPSLWIEGRVVHLIHTSQGVVTPVPLEIAVEALPTVVRAAAVSIV